MNKLPVFRTYGNALGFAFGSYFTVLRLTWLPFAAWIGSLFVLGYLLQATVLPPEFAQADDAQAVIKNWELFGLIQLFSVVLQVLIFAIVAVTVHRIILFDDRKPGEYFNFPFGMTEFVYILMGFASFLICVALLAAILVPVLYVSTSGDLAGFFESFKNWPENIQNLAASGVMGPVMFGYFIAWLIVIYVFVRLAVWPPSVVATGRFSPAEAWGLTRGNFWRFIGLFLLVVITIWAIVVPPVAAFFFYATRTAVEANPQGTAVTPADIEAFRTRMEVYAPLFWLAYLLVYVFMTGFSVALVSYAYKALKGYDAKEAIPA